VPLRRPRTPADREGTSVAKAKTARPKAGRNKTTKKVVKKAPAKAAAKKKAAPKKAAPKKAAPNKAASKKAASKKASSKKASSKKASSKKAAPKKKVVAKKPAPKKAAPKKAAPKKKVVAKKPAPKKAAPKKVAPKKVAPKKAAPKKAAPKKAAPKKAAPKKVAPKKVAPKKAATAKAASKKKVVTKKVVTKVVIASKAASKKAATKKTPRSAKVELAPRVHVVAPSIPIPVKKVPRKPTLEERAEKVTKRISKQSTDFRARYNESFEMSWIYHDTALEGIVYTFDELTSAFCSDEVTVVDSSVMPIYDAIRRYKAAIDFVTDAADKKRVPVTVDLLKKIYVNLHPEEGDAKTVKYRRDVPQHRLYFHEYSSPDKIAYRVRQTIEWVTKNETKKSVSTLRMAAKAHYDLARAYPFALDSGKLARLFMNLLLIRGGLPPAIIHATERQRYYEALKAPSAANLLKMLQDSVENALSSIEKLLDQHETRTRGFGN
jgi:Fic family protein